MNWDLAVLDVEPTLMALIAPYEAGNRSLSFRCGRDERCGSVLRTIITPNFEKVLEPVPMRAAELVETACATQQASSTVLGIILAVVALAFEIWVVFELGAAEVQVRKVLRLLLHVDHQVLTSTPRVMRVLGGHFGGLRTDMVGMDASMSDEVLMNLPDAVMYAAESSRKIQGANESCKKIFGSDTLIGRPIEEVVNGKRFFGANVATLFEGPTSITVEMRTEDGSEVFYEATSAVHSEWVIVFFQDVTQTVRYNQLITEERARSDELLKSILPPSIVPRVQAGETDISFSVQSASVSFIDVVEFTPWCGGSEASHVMKTLNLMFKFFDQEIAARSSLMRTKCIGDCYVSGGGIFMTENQPVVHARELSSFGLAALECLKRVNEALNETLRIRVGINTGGPLVAGVLGGAKPTFEILGPAINMAQQMEHHGVPMAVHVSRATYELIYGEGFECKERGQVEIKNGMVVTYLVTGFHARDLRPTASRQTVLPPPPPAGLSGGGGSGPTGPIPPSPSRRGSIRAVHSQPASPVADESELGHS
jgi:class 3 adenylate cyclase